MWGHDAGLHNGVYDLPADSRMTAAEGAFYLGLHNLTFITIGNKPAAVRPACAVVIAWMKASSGRSSATVPPTGPMWARWCCVARSFQTSPGGSWTISSSAAEAVPVARHSADELKAFKRQMAAGARLLDLWVTLYEHNLDADRQGELGVCDVVTYWTWKAELLKTWTPASIDEDLAALHHRAMLGCYMWDYGTRSPMPMDMMKHQCERGLAWIKDGTIDGMIFLASCICDLGLETVEWVRGWIKEVGPTPLPARRESVKARGGSDNP